MKSSVVATNRLLALVWCASAATITLSGVVTASESGTSRFEGPVYQISSVVSAPELERKTEPRYPETLRAAKVIGTIVLAFVVDPLGVPQNIVVKRGLGETANLLAIHALGDWKFKPAERYGKPVAVRTTVEIQIGPWLSLDEVRHRPIPVDSNGSPTPVPIRH